MAKIPTGTAVKIIFTDVVVSGILTEYDREYCGVLVSAKEAEKLNPIGSYFHSWKQQDGIIWINRGMVKIACRLNRRAR